MISKNPLIFIFLKILFIFREKEKEGDKHQCVVATHGPPTWDQFAATQACALTGNRTGTLWSVGWDSVC